MVLSLLLVTAMGYAQPPGGPGGPGGGFGGRGGFGGFGGGFGGRGGFGGDMLGLLRDENVRKAISMTEEEQGYVQLLGEELRSSGESMREELRNLPREEVMERIRERMEARNKEVEDGLTEILGKDRVARLKQIQIQVAGPMALASPDVREKLDLSEDQQQELREAMGDVEEEVAAYRRKLQQEKMESVMTDAQRKAWRDLTGEPIDFSVAPRSRFRSRGGDDDGRGRGRGRGEGGGPGRPGA